MNLLWGAPLCLTVFSFDRVLFSRVAVGGTCGCSCFRRVWSPLAMANQALESELGFPSRKT